MTCRRLKAWLSQNCIEFEDRNVSLDPALVEEFRELGHKTLPTAVVAGTPIVGFHNEWSGCIQRLKELLGFRDDGQDEYDLELEDAT